MKSIRLTAFCMLAVILFPRLLFGQPDSGFRVGVVFGPQYNAHTGVFSTQDATYPCCTFNTTSTWMYQAGIMGMYSFSAQFGLTARFSYELLSANFADQSISHPVLTQNNQLATLAFNQSLVSSLPVYTIGVFVRYELPVPALYLTAGPSISIAAKNNFKQTETILDPNYVFYGSDSDAKVLFDKSLDKINSTQFAMCFGAGYMLEITDRIAVNPEALYSFALTKFTKTDSWKVGRFDVTVGILYGL